jgi:hypothetical protein
MARREQPARHELGGTIEEDRMNTTAIGRLLATLSARRALLGGSFAALALTVLPDLERETAGKPARRRQNRQRGRNRGRGRPGATPCTVCDDADDCPFTSVQAAINAASAGGTVTICKGTYEGNVTISRNLTLAADQGEDVEMEGTGSGSVVTVPAGVTAFIQGLVITGGAGSPDDRGFLRGGGILNSGTLTVTNCDIVHNTAQLGGGLYNDDGAELTIVNSGVVNRTFVSENSGGDGGGIYNTGNLTISGGAEVLDNDADGNGGGIFNQGQVTIDEGNVIGNTAAGDGGGIMNLVGSLTIRNNSFVADNKATNSGGFGGGGGGIYNEFGATLTISGSSVSANEADEQGGGIFNIGTVSLQNTLVDDNDADDTGGGIFNSNGSVSLSGTSRVVDNKPNDCVGTSACAG